jgi:hypothetical protein
VREMRKPHRGRELARDLGGGSGAAMSPRKDGAPPTVTGEKIDAELAEDAALQARYDAVLEPVGT